MKARSKRLRITFYRPFTMAGVERPFPFGNYEVVNDAELIADAIRPVYRQVFALIYSQPHRPSSIGRVDVDLSDLLAAHDRDQGMKESLQCH